MSAAAKTATIVRRERTGHVYANNWQGGVRYEWVTTFFRDGEQWTTAVSRTRTEARERCSDLGYTVTAEGREP
jgi:hypothetical protein